MTLVRIVMLCMGALFFASCQPPAPEEPAAPAMEGPIAAVPGAAATMDIGTVETTLLIEGAIADRTPMDTIEQDILGGMRGSTSLATYTVSEPVPRPFWLRFSISARETYDRPVVLRGHIYRDDTPLRPAATVISTVVPPEMYPQEFMVDALEGLETLPASTLLVLKADVFLLPKDADPAEIDLENFTAPNGNGGFVMSNPVRLVFPAAEAAP